MVGAPLPSMSADAGRGLQFARCQALGLIILRLLNESTLIGGGKGATGGLKLMERLCALGTLLYVA